MAMRTLLRRAGRVLAITISLAAFARAQTSSILQPKLSPQDSNTKQTLIAISPVTAQIVWASGRGGTFLHTIDGGANWIAGVVPGAEQEQFRDVQGVSEKVAYLLSIGDKPSDFKVYKTEDAGVTWNVQFQNQNPKAFYDCFAFWTPTHGISHSDSVDGVFPDLSTSDGKTWQSIGVDMPSALPNESSFASSGTCVATQGDSNAWIVTGGATVARVLATKDAGKTWHAYPTPFASSAVAGAFTIDFRGALHGIIGGGNLDLAHLDTAKTATSSDGGMTWALTAPPPVTGAIYGLSYARRTDGKNDGIAGSSGNAVVITANTGGAAWTPNEGKTWFALPNITGYWAVAFANPQTGWLVGTGGTILKISF